jgi:hypothetical protein
MTTAAADLTIVNYTSFLRAGIAAAANITNVSRIVDVVILRGTMNSK